MNKVGLHIKGLSYSQTQSGAYALVLGEDDGERRLPIIIGGFEAQSIAIALEQGVNPPRPLTHDLFKNFSEQVDVRLKEVVIHKLQDGVFYSILIWDKQGEEITLDARTSDAVALAIRFDAPIYTYPEILDKAGIILKEGVSSDESPKSLESKEPAKIPVSTTDELKNKSMDELHALLDQAVANEDYETAARVRDEIDKRSAN